MRRAVISAHEQVGMMSPWGYPIAAPAIPSEQMPTTPGEPMTGRPPKTPSLDPVNDPMGRLNKAPYKYHDMVDNLVSHYHGSSDQEKKSGRLWYRAARDLFTTTAKDRGISPARAVATGAAFSPLTDWGENVKHANDFLMRYNPEHPDHNEHDWRMAHIHPKALAAFRQTEGRDPTEHDDDLHKLADLHSGGSFRPSESLDNPDRRQEWMENIQHHGIDKVLQDHAGQVNANKLKKPTADNPEGGYNPAISMRDAGIKTLGGNITKAKLLNAAPDDKEAFAQALGGPKIRNFMSNILDGTRIGKNGYYVHPNGDWTQHKDLGGTIDAHHLRAASMAHGAWQKKAYGEGAQGLDPSNRFTYDVFNRGLFEATHRVNSTIEDPRKHITPKQLQAIVWLKHKNDNDRFKPMGIDHEHQITPELQQAHDLKMQKRQMAGALEPEEFGSMPPLWRKMFLQRKSPEWADLLEAWVKHHSPEDAEHDGADPKSDPDPHSLNTPAPPALNDPRLGTVYAAIEAIAYSDDIVGR